MKIAILDCGVPLKTGNYVDMFINMLQKNGRQSLYSISCFNVCLNEYPDINCFDCYLVTGSISDAHSDEAWIIKLKNFCSDVYSQGKKMIGICFGHQLLSFVFGGASKRAPNGWELGVRSLSFTESFKNMFGNLNHDSSEMYNIFEIHQDQVFQLPPSATLLAYSKNCPFEMYCVGNQVLCMQGHPEFTREAVEDSIESISERTTSEVINFARNSMGLEVSDVFVELIHYFLSSM